MENYIGTKTPMINRGFQEEMKGVLTGWSTSQLGMLNNNWLILTTNE